MSMRQGIKLEELQFDNRALEALPIDASLRQGVSAEPIGADETKESTLCTYPRNQIARACFSLARATPLSYPTLVAASPDALSLLNLDAQQAERDEFVSCFSGNQTVPGARPAAHNYAGHQFGAFSGQLGDGACLYLGEVVVPQANAPPKRWELQIKGAGKTAYSRSGDGRKLLRSCVREFLGCEALHYLGIPTVRAGCCISSATAAVRDMFYTGDNVEERCGTVLRIAETFLRFGSFEIFVPTDQVTGQRGPSAGLAIENVPVGLGANGKHKFLGGMLEFVVQSYFPQVEESVQAQLTEHTLSEQEATGAARAAVLRSRAMLREVVRRTARLVAMWEAVGFCHGLLNTDHMSLVGITLGLGPFSFLDRYSRLHCPCVSDDTRRYAFKAQKEVCKWNCYKLAEVLSEVLGDEEGQVIVAAEYDVEHDAASLLLFRQKLGLQRIIDLRAALAQREADAAKAAAKAAAAAANAIAASEREREKAERERDAAADAAAGADAAVGVAHSEIERMGVQDEDDALLIQELLLLMEETGADFTLTFRALERIDDLRDTQSLDRFVAYMLALLPGAATMAASFTTPMPAEQIESLLLLSGEQAGTLAALGTVTAALLEEMQQRERAQELQQQAALGPHAKQQQDAVKWRAWAEKYWFRLLKEVVKDEVVKDEGASSAAAAAAAAAAFELALRRRRRAMRSRNPHTVPRTYMLHIAAQRASGQESDVTEVVRLLHLLSDPYSADLEIDLAFSFDRTSASVVKPTNVVLRWLTHRALPPRETLTVYLPRFSHMKADERRESAGSDAQEERRRLPLQGDTSSHFKAFWRPVTQALHLVVTKLLSPGESVVLEIPRDAGLCAPVDGVVFKMAREEWLPPRADWYQVTIAEEYKGLPPEWAASLRLSCCC